MIFPAKNNEAQRIYLFNGCLKLCVIPILSINGSWVPLENGVKAFSKWHQDFWNIEFCFVILLFLSPFLWSGHRLMMAYFSPNFFIIRAWIRSCVSKSAGRYDDVMSCMRFLKFDFMSHSKDRVYPVHCDLMSSWRYILFWSSNAFMVP